MLNFQTFFWTFLGFSQLFFQLSVGAAKTIKDEFEKAQVYFEVQKNRGSLTLIGKKRGVGGEVNFTFRTDEPDDTNLGPCSDSFYVKKQADGWIWVYGSQDTQEYLELKINSDGGISLLEHSNYEHSNYKYTDFENGKTYGFKTPSIFKNDTSLAFYSLVVSANQIHNFGTIRANTVFFNQSYLYNAGVIQFGVKQEDLEAVNLMQKIEGSTSPQPNYQKGTVENHGIIQSDGLLEIKDGLNYIEARMSNFCELNMSGGALKIKEDACMKVRGALTGVIKEIVLEKRAKFFGLSYSAPNCLQNFCLQEEAEFYTSSTLNLGAEKISNKGAVCSSGFISLRTENLETLNKVISTHSVTICNHGESVPLTQFQTTFVKIQPDGIQRILKGQDKELKDLIEFEDFAFLLERARCNRKDLSAYFKYLYERLSHLGIPALPSICGALWSQF